jgi:VanZ family protein
MKTNKVFTFLIFSVFMLLYIVSLIFSQSDVFYDVCKYLFIVPLVYLFSYLLGYNNIKFALYVTIGLVIGLFTAREFELNSVLFKTFTSLIGFAISYFYYLVIKRKSENY